MKTNRNWLETTRSRAAKDVDNRHIDLKVSYFQNEFMKLSFLPKYEQNIIGISSLGSEGRNADNFLFIFWEKR